MHESILIMCQQVQFQQNSKQYKLLSINIYFYLNHHIFHIFALNYALHSLFISIIICEKFYARYCQTMSYALTSLYVHFT